MPNISKTDNQENNDLIATFTGLINWQNAGLRKISVNLAGHSTSFSLEKPFLDILQNEAQSCQLPFAQLVRLIDDQRPTNINLSSALRLAALAIAARNMKQI